MSKYIKKKAYPYLFFLNSLLGQKTLKIHANAFKMLGFLQQHSTKHSKFYSIDFLRTQNIKKAFSNQNTILIV